MCTDIGTKLIYQLCTCPTFYVQSAACWYFVFRGMVYVVDKGKWCLNVFNCAYLHQVIDGFVGIIIVSYQIIVFVSRQS